MHVAVIGPGHDATDIDLQHAYAVGRLLAQRGCTVISGGLGGIMAEAARGCTETGGTCIGLLPGADNADANQHLTIALSTGLGELRNLLVVRTAHAVIAIGGSWGTLSELAFAERIGKATVSLHGWQVADADGAIVPIRTATTPAEAVEAVLGAGSVTPMPEQPEDERVESRAELLPEEVAAGSDDPERQAEIILEDSDERTEHPEETKRRSTQTPDRPTQNG